MKQAYLLAARLWIIQAVTGLSLVAYVVIHTLDNGMILVSPKAFEDMLKLWHSIPRWFYVLMVLGLVAVILVHMANGIRIASKPYKQIDVSWFHNIKLKHSGTIFWFTQVISGSFIAIFAVWHLIVQHGADPTMTAAQSAARVTPVVFLVYLLFIAALMFHSFNGVRSVLVKFGIMTDKAKESLLVGLMALLFIVFFLLGAFSIGEFLAKPDSIHNGGVIIDVFQPASPPDYPVPDENGTAIENQGGGVEGGGTSEGSD
jgi:fumarate reductase subunit C